MDRQTDKMRERERERQTDRDRDAYMCEGPEVLNISKGSISELR